MNTQIPTVKLSQSRLKELLNYDPETGIFTWKVSRNQFTYPGHVAGSPTRDGYVAARVNGRLYQLHRLAFLWMTGEFPKETVDHINGVRDDNRWVNLREITFQENQHNTAIAYKNSRSGFLGVHFNKAKGKWRAAIQADKKRHTLGYFQTPELAFSAYLKAKDELHPTHLRLKDAV